MLRRNAFLLFFFFLFLQSHSQSSGKDVVKETLQQIARYDSIESRKDSLANHPLGTNTEEDHLRRYNFYKGLYGQLEKIDKSHIDFDDEINIGLLEYEIEDEISSYKYKSYLNPILSDEGFQTELAGMGSAILGTQQEFDDYLRKLRDIPHYVGTELDFMRKGLTLGICQPRAILSGYENTYEQHIVDNPEKSVFWAPFTRKPFGIDEATWKKITDTARSVIMQYAVEGFKNIKDFFDKEYLPRTRTTIGVSNFPDGLNYYQDRVRHYTTTNMSYEDIYQLGLKEVERIKEEMMEVLKELKFTGTMKEFIAYLRTDPRFYVTTPEQLLKEASFIAKKADGSLPLLFGKLPRQPYGVEPVPAYLAPTYTAGRYSGSSINSKNSGHYWVNTYDLKSRPLYALEALTLHEAVPGHHLQTALTQELTQLPEFRRNLYVNAYGEGWGLYCEFLGTELGFYKDPYSRFGKLTYEMWRACRLVLDVALHTKGWTREQGVNYLSENTALSLREVNTEINRYISWPGQALAYKIGELKIKELRKMAETKLKERFDVREFHDLVLSQGSVTMLILERMVNKYVDEKMAGKDPSH